MENISTRITLDNNPEKYIIIYKEGFYLSSGSAYISLEEEVNSRLKKGWKLCGGVSIGNIGNDHFCICQAMTK